MAEGRLDMAEFEERLDAAYRARTYGELAPITRDLPTPASGDAQAPISMVKAPHGRDGVAGTRGAPPGSAANWPARIGGAPTSSRAFALFSGFQRKGRWTVSRVFSAFMMFGGGEIDLREASFEDRDVTIRCFAILGGMQVTVPPELDVHVSGIGILGGFDVTRGLEEDTHPDAPRVRVTGFALLGGVGVERKLTRAEKQRLKEARRPDSSNMHEARRSFHEALIEYREDRREALEERREERRDAHRERRRAAREYRADRRGGRRGRYAPDDYDR
jgi:hypothetical protein